MSVIEVRALRKEYRRLRGGATIALDGLNLSVERGGVFGFLGPNGSGKTTTIRCLLGLAIPDAGSITVLGANSRAELPRVMGRIGALVEAPALFPTFTAKRNLELLASLDHIDHRRIDEVLDIVGLRDREKDLVKRYSLGMRQRLGIAAALLKDPELLILDEPANGLDPAGIRKVRGLLRRLGDEGRTILLSSHILTEVQLTCDRVAILSRGRLVTQGAVDEVLSQGKAGGLLLKLEDLEAGARVLAGAGIKATNGDGALHVDIQPHDADLVSRVLAGAGLYPRELRPQETDLEAVFLELTAPPTNEDAA